MKIDKAIRDAYADQLSINQLVRERVEAARKKFDPRWHYESRLKSEESFALKIEAGRANEHLVIDDFFGCTFVVRNSSEIAEATLAIEESFEIVSRKPKDAKATAGRPSEFQFDDLRLYAKLRPSYRGHEPIHDVVFEIQIKTFLLHAWGIATHDLTYKTDSVSWAKLRVAYQIRAMLEHAELSIEQFGNLAGSQIIAKDHDEYTSISKIIAEIQSIWDASALPADLQRLAQAVRSAARLLQVKIDDVFASVKADTLAGAGARNLNLSPFGVIVQCILQNHQIDVNTVLESVQKKKRFDKIMIPKLIDIPGHLSPLHGKVIVSY